MVSEGRQRNCSCFRIREMIRSCNEFDCRNYNAEIFAFASRLREPFDEDLLKRAFTLRSYVNKERARREELEIPSEIQMEDNEELASRGYALASSYVKRYLRAVLRFVPEEGIQ